MLNKGFFWQKGVWEQYIKCVKTNGLDNSRKDGCYKDFVDVKIVVFVVYFSAILVSFKTIVDRKQGSGFMVIYFVIHFINTLFSKEFLSLPQI